MDVRLPEPINPTARDLRVGIEHPDDDSTNLAFNESFCAWNLWMVSSGARFKCAIDGSSNHGLVRQLLLKCGEFSMISGSLFAAIAH